MAVTDMTQNREIVGRVSRIPALNEPKIIISMDLIKLIPKNGVENNWLYSFFKYSDIGDEIKHFANGANVLHLDPKVVMEQKLVLPAKNIRDKFSEDISKIFFILDKLELKNQNLRKTRDLLLPKLISGEIDVSGLDIKVNEPMEVEVSA
jgi:type I restriction enzyme, S subunit